MTTKPFPGTFGPGEKGRLFFLYSAKKSDLSGNSGSFQKLGGTDKNWKAALNRFMMEFEDRLAEYV